MAGTVLLLKHLLELDIFPNTQRMAKQPGEGPPWPKDSDQEEKKGVGRYAAILARVDRHTEDTPDPQPMERTEFEGGASVRILPDAQKSNRSGRRERTRGGKVSKKAEDIESTTPEVVQEYEVPAVTDGVTVTETRKERQEALRDAVLRKQAELDAASKRVIPLSDQTEERLREIKDRLGANRVPNAGVPYGTLPPIVSAPKAEPTTPTVTKADGMNEYLERTRGEKTRKLSEKLEGFVPPADDKYLSNALYERRVTNFAERTGLTAERDALAAAEAAYYTVRKNSYAKPGKDTEKLKTLKQAYTDSLFAWNKALESKASLDEKSRIEALVIRKRDTILRPQSLEVQARKAGMSQKEWSDIGKYLNRDTVENVAKVASVPAGFLGKGIAMFHKSAQGNSPSAKLQREILGKRYGRAAMIVGGAAAATMVALSTAPVTAAAGALTFGVFVGRGVIGTVAGTVGGYASGGIYQKFFGNKKRQQLDIAKGMKKGFSTKEEYEAFLKEYGNSNVHMRGKEKARWQIAGSLIAGGSTGLATSPVAHFALDQMGALSSVQSATDTIASGGSASGADAPRVPEAAPPASDAAPVAGVAPEAAPAIAPDAAPVAPSAPEGPFLQEAVIGRGEGFNQLFVDIRNSDFAGTTAVGRMLLNGELSATELSDRIGAFDPSTGESMVMQIGDKLVLDSNENLWFVRADGEAQLLMENPTSPTGEVIVHELRNIPMSETPVQAAETRPTPPPAVVHNEVPAVGLETSDSPAGIAQTLEQSAETPEAVAVEVSTADIPRTIEDSVREVQQETPVASSESFAPSQQGAEDGTRTIEDSIREAGLFSPEGVVNSHGIEVNPSVPATYEWKLPDVDRPYTVIFGGSAEEISRAVQAEIRLDPTAHVLVNTPVVDAQTGELTIRVDEWRIGEQGEPQRVEGVQDALGRSLPPITAENLIRKLR